MAPPFCSVIENDCLNFLTVPLCDTSVIVDASAFIRELRRHQAVVKGFGLSPLQVASIFRHAVERFLFCNVRPIFIFQGVYNRIVSSYFLFNINT